MTYYVFRRYYRTLHDIISYIQQTADKGAVAIFTFVQERFTATCFRQFFTNKTTFRTGWHYYGIFYCLRFYQPQYFSTEVFTPI